MAVNFIQKCNDPVVVKVAEQFKEGLIKVGEKFHDVNGKVYRVRENGGITSTKQEGDSIIKKTYIKMPNSDEWDMTSREVSNDRGFYARISGKTSMQQKDTVYLGSMMTPPFVKVKGDCYLRHGAIIPSEQLEAAIDYVKGKGAIENYEKMLHA